MKLHLLTVIIFELTLNTIQRCLLKQAVNVYSFIFLVVGRMQYNTLIL